MKETAWAQHSCNKTVTVSNFIDKKVKYCISCEVEEVYI